MIIVKVQCVCKSCLDLYKRVHKRIDPDLRVKIGWDDGELQIYDDASEDIARRLEAAFIGGEMYLERTLLKINQEEILKSLKSDNERAECISDLRSLISTGILKPDDDGFEIITKILEFEDKRSFLMRRLSNPLLSIESYWDIMKEGMEMLLKLPDLQEQSRKTIGRLSGN